MVIYWNVFYIFNLFQFYEFLIFRVIFFGFFFIVYQVFQGIIVNVVIEGWVCQEIYFLLESKVNFIKGFEDRSK